MERHLSKRLATVAHYVPLHSCLLDIGSDHAYLPIWLVQNGIISSAIASEVARGPYQNMVRDIREAGVAKQIQIRLANGLAAVTAQDHFNVVTIAGMGGLLITNILSQGYAKLDCDPLLILQPNVSADQVRTWLMKHHYRITHERMIVDQHQIYEIVVAERVSESVKYTRQQLFFGPILLKAKGPIFNKKWHNEAKHLHLVLQQMHQAKRRLPMEKIHKVTKKLNLIKQVITDEN